MFGIRDVELVTDARLLVGGFPWQMFWFLGFFQSLYLCPSHSFTHTPLSNVFWHEISYDK